MVQKIIVEKFACSYCGYSYDTHELALNCEVACSDEQNALSVKSKLVNAVSLAMTTSDNLHQLETKLNEALSSFVGKENTAIRILEFRIQASLVQGVSADVSIVCDLCTNNDNSVLIVTALKECGWTNVTLGYVTRLSAKISLSILPPISKRFDDWLLKAKMVSNQAEAARDTAKLHLKTVVLVSVLRERAELRAKLVELDEQVRRAIETENKKLENEYVIQPFDIQHNVFFNFPKTINNHTFD